MSGTLESIGTLLGSALSGGGAGAIASAVTEALRMINNLTKDDPVKSAKARREFILKMVEVVRETQSAGTGADVTDLVVQLTKLLDE